MNSFIKYLEEKIEGCEMTKAPYRDKIIYQLVLDEYKEQLIIPVVDNSVFIITENDNYGRPLYHDTFKTLQEAKKYIDSVDHLDLDRNFTNIVEKEFD